ncbi:MAG: hypothetical protein IKD08_06705 [Alphaproteobacteria bacterium]|nr:hypothetical protein [Alphaproteobacteria bacterium]
METFKYTSYAFDAEKGVLSLNYAVDDAYTFTERIIFPKPFRNLSEKEERALLRVFRALHIAAGVSYYKAFLCPKMEVMTEPLTHNEAVFFTDFYIKGLGEFSFRNDVVIKPDFKPEANYVEPETLDLPQRILVPVGGGKDSSVVTEVLKNAGYKPVLFAVGQPKPIKECMEVAGLETLIVKREVSPLLLELNQANNTFNGHVPVTGILSFIMAAVSILYGFSAIVMANERSANVGNVRKDDMTVNHQWSKSLEFETAFRNFVGQNLFLGLEYFSLLRGVSELAIAKKFAELKAYHPVFTSCNRAFKIDESKRIEHWCGVCDKCRFVFLALAPFMKKAEMVKIFGTNLLAEPSQERGYKELLGLAAYKPFECVGEIEESAAALSLLASEPEWQDDYIVQKLLPEVEAKYGDCQNFIRDAFTKSRKHNIPKEYLSALG